MLCERGVRVVFVIEESFAGTLEAQGFEEALMRLKPPPSEPEEPGQFWKDFIRETAPQFRKPTVEQIETLTVPIWAELVDGARYVDERLRELLDELQPDVIVEDNVVAFPAVVASGRPWVRIVSCNPLELPDPHLPPAYSGYSTADRSGWDEFRARYRDATAALQAEFSAFCAERGAPPLPQGQFIHESPHLDLYLYPAELDYSRTRPLAPVWHRLDSNVRRAREAWEPPPGDEALVYLSLGSLGSGDVDLMNRLIGFLAETPYRYVVSMGPQHEAIRLADNMTGAEFLPQPAILDHVDLVITHGGNNTVTEALHFGKPMIVLPLFWDQYDNAQRVAERGFGVRLAPYDVDGATLRGAVDRLLADEAVRRRASATGDRLRRNPGPLPAAELIAALA